jgi:hypothetical protein
MDARRLELYELLKPKLEEEPARALVLALPPSPDALVTKDDLAAAFERFGATMDIRFAQIDARFAQIDARFAQSEATLTRRMITIMGAWTILFGSTVGWALALVRP